MKISENSLWSSESQESIIDNTLLPHEQPSNHPLIETPKTPKITPNIYTKNINPNKIVENKNTEQKYNTLIDEGQKVEEEKNDIPVISGNKRVCPEFTLKRVKEEERDSKSDTHFMRADMQIILATPIKKVDSVDEIGRNKFNPSIFANLKMHEKNLLLYEHYVLGSEKAGRKWGLNNTGINFHANKIFKCSHNRQIFKTTWLNVQKVLIRKRMNEMKKRDIKDIEGKLWDNSREKNITLKKIYFEGLDRGIAIPAAKYSMDLFELEYLIRNRCQTEWSKMKQNDWYLIPASQRLKEHPNELYNSRKEKLNIIAIAKKEGRIYASKIFGIRIDLVSTYNRLLNKR